MKLESLKELYIEQIRDVYDAEHQLLAALPSMEEKATSPVLRSAFALHSKETANQTFRLKLILEALGVRPGRKRCKAMKGLLTEGHQYVKARGDLDTLDAALIAAAQRIEHYEIAVYGTLRTYAILLGFSEQAGLLQASLDEEALADQNLSAIAETWVNELAAMPEIEP